MATGSTCATCGAPLRADVSFCPKCGTAVGPSQAGTVSAPLHRPRKRISRRTIGIVVVVILAIVAGLSVYEYEYRPGGPMNPYIVKVNQVIWTIDGGSFSSSPGFSVHAGRHVTVSATEMCEPVSGFFSTSPQTCSSGSVYILTAGFGIASTNAPFTWSSGDSGSPATVTVVVTTPGSSYAGNLFIDLH
jgi:hypothetical protein